MSAPRSSKPLKILNSQRISVHRGHCASVMVSMPSFFCRIHYVEKTSFSLKSP